MWIADEQAEALRVFNRPRDESKNAKGVSPLQFDKFLVRNERVNRGTRGLKHSTRFRVTRASDARGNPA